ncbi:hypothetical protein D3C84_525250 [compost metagenome]
MEHVERGNREIGLGLTTSGWEPDQVDDFAVVGVPFDKSGDAHQQEGRLECTPASDIGPFRAGGPDIPSGARLTERQFLGRDVTIKTTEGAALELLGRDLLQQHALIRQPERFQRSFILLQDGNPTSDTHQTLPAVIKMALSHILIMCIQPCALLFPCRNPRRVLVCETGECLPARTALTEGRQPGEFAHRQGDQLVIKAPNVGRHTREFHGRHNIRENHFRRVAIHPIPASGTAMSDRPGGRITVEQREGLLVVIELLERPDAFGVAAESRTALDAHFEIRLEEHTADALMLRIQEVCILQVPQYTGNDPLAMHAPGKQLDLQGQSTRQVQLSEYRNAMLQLGEHKPLARFRGGRRNTPPSIVTLLTASFRANDLGALLVTAIDLERCRTRQLPEESFLRRQRHHNVARRFLKTKTDAHYRGLKHVSAGDFEIVILPHWRSIEAFGSCFRQHPPL